MKNACSKLEQTLKSGRLALTAEIGPPKHTSPEGIVANACLLKDYVDAANVTDCQSAVVRMSSLAASLHIHHNGLEPIFQMTCRDRNRIAIQSDLLRL